MWNISDAGPVAVYTAVRLWHQSPDFINVSRRKNEQLANSVTRVIETEWAPSATQAAMDQLLRAGAIALAALLCVATQVRPAYLQ